MIDTASAISAVTLEEAKHHLRVDHNEDDALIKALCLSCTQLAEHELQRALVSREGIPGFGATSEATPAGVKQWILLHVGFFYENRSSAVESTKNPLPFLDALLDPWRTWK